MSVRPRSAVVGPELTVRTAWASDPRGTTAMWVRDHLDGLWSDEDFSSWCPRAGRPGFRRPDRPRSAYCSSCSTPPTSRRPRRRGAGSTSGTPWLQRPHGVPAPPRLAGPDPGTRMEARQMNPGPKIPDGVARRRLRRQRHGVHVRGTCADRPPAPGAGADRGHRPALRRPADLTPRSCR